VEGCLQQAPPGGDKEAMGQWVFDEIADGIRKTRP